MLKPAILYSDDLIHKFRKVWFEDKYKFWNNTSYFDDWNPSDTTWTNHQFASVDDNIVIGYIGYSIDRADGDIVNNLNIINFENKPSTTFAADMKQAITDIFEKYNFRKLNFTVVIGNPVEKHYDRLIKRYGGRIVGVRKQNCRLIDGKYYDEKLYEIMRDDYFKSRGKRVNKDA